jgi:hypothetical protein
MPIDWSRYVNPNALENPSKLPTFSEQDCIDLAARVLDVGDRAASLARFLIQTGALMPPVARASEAAAKRDFLKLRETTYEMVVDETVTDVTMSCKTPRGPMLYALKLGAACSLASGFFHRKHRVKCAGYNKMSPHQAWYGDGLTAVEHEEAFTKVIRATLRTNPKKVAPSNFHAGLRLGNSTYSAAQFKVTHARAIYEHYLPGSGVVVDFCCGWGDRLAGFFATPHATLYIGCDPNPATWAAYLCQVKAYDRWTFVPSQRHPTYPSPQIDIAENVRFSFRSHHCDKQVIIYQCAAEDLPWDTYDGTVDLIFTSPPFCSTEKYAADADADAVADQSWFRYKTIKEWNAGFLLPVMARVTSLLAPGGHLCVNILDATYAKASDESTVTVLHEWAARPSSSLTYLGYVALLMKGAPKKNGTIARSRCEPLWVWMRPPKTN